MVHLKRIIYGMIVVTLIVAFFAGLRYVIMYIPHGLVILGFILVLMAAYVFGFLLDWIFGDDSDK